MVDIGKRNHYHQQRQEQQVSPSSTRSSLRVDTIESTNANLDVKEIEVLREESSSTKTNPNQIEASSSFPFGGSPRPPIDNPIVESREQESINTIGHQESGSDRNIDIDIPLNNNNNNNNMTSTALEAVETPRKKNGIDHHVQRREESSTPPTRGVRFSDDNQQDPQSNSNNNLSLYVKAMPSSSEEETLTPASQSPSPILSTMRKHKTSTLATRPSVFERLSNTETVASLHQKFHPQLSSITKSRTAERRMKRSTSAPPSLRAKNSRPKSSPNQVKKKKGIVPPTTENKKTPYLTQKFAQLASSFERLSEKHTALSKSRRRERNDPNNNNNNNVNNDHKNSNSRSKRSNSLGRRHSFGRRQNNYGQFNTPSRQVQRSQMRNPSKINNRQKDRNKQANDALADAFEDESLGPPLEIEFSSRMKILCSNKFMPEEGFTELDVFELGLNPFLSEYEAGSTSAKHFASEIMHALLWRDLPSEVKWDVQRPLERELAMPIGEIGYSFMIEATGKSIYQDSDMSDEEGEGKDDEDLLMYTASAAGHVTFLPDWEIQVENYSCVHDVY